MRTTVTLDDDLLRKATDFSGIKDKSKLLRFTLEQYVQRMAARRLAALGGTMPDLVVPGRGDSAAGSLDWPVGSKVADLPE
jgi:Arc/MetJ family transcription regulator